MTIRQIQYLKITLQKMISAIIVAAGLSTRMGEQNKLLLPYKGKPLFLHITDALLDSQVDEIIVVTGFEAERICQALGNRNVNLSHNPNYKTGLTSSIQTGIKASHQDATAYLICLSDMPFIQSKHIDKIVAALDKNKPQQILMPRINQQKSHPILFASFYKEKLLNHKIPTGCKAIIQENKKHLNFVDFTEDFSQDIDTPKSYQQLNERDS